MGNNKKSSRSSRGRSNYVKTMQRSYAKPKRVRKDEAMLEAAKKDDEISVMLKGVITGGIAGLIAGTVLGRAILFCLIGCIVGGLIGCIADLVQSKGLFKKKEK